MWEDLFFLYADKHQSFLKTDATIFGGLGQACPDILSNCGILTTKISQLTWCAGLVKFYLFLFKAEDKQEGIIQTIGFKFLPKQSSMWCVFL